VDVEYGYYPDDAKLVVSSYRLMHTAVTGTLMFEPFCVSLLSYLDSKNAHLRCSSVRVGKWPRRSDGPDARISLASNLDRVKLYRSKGQCSHKYTTVFCETFREVGNEILII